MIEKINIKKMINIRKARGMILLENGFEPKEVSEIITSGTIPKYLHKLISSQVDVDRFDYLLRDALMTGNPHGRYDLERILHTIRLNDSDEIYISKGGWYAVEHYLNCRYQMHKQVYYHHSTMAAQELLYKIIERARYIYDNTGISLNEKFIPLIKEDVDLKEFLEINDSDILIFIKIIRQWNDKILKDLSNRFFNRRLFKTFRIEKREAMKLYESKEKIDSIFNKRGLDKNYYCSHVDLSSKRAYKPYTPKPKDKENAIFINSDCSVEISEKIVSLEAIATPDEILLFLPENCVNEVNEVLL